MTEPCFVKGCYWGKTLLCTLPSVPWTMKFSIWLERASVIPILSELWILYLHSIEVILSYFGSFSPMYGLLNTQVVIWRAPSTDLWHSPALWLSFLWIRLSLSACPANWSKPWFPQTLYSHLLNADSSGLSWSTTMQTGNSVKVIILWGNSTVTSFVSSQGLLSFIVWCSVSWKWLFYIFCTFLVILDGSF